MIKHYHDQQSKNNIHNEEEPITIDSESEDISNVNNEDNSQSIDAFAAAYAYELAKLAQDQSNIDNIELTSNKPSDEDHDTDQMYDSEIPINDKLEE